jgi:hypothetical protein
MNSEFMHERSKHFAARLIAAAPDNGRRLNLAFESALGRLPSPEEARHAEEYLRLSERKLEAARVSADQLVQESWASYLRALLSSNEFIYMD